MTHLADVEIDELAAAIVEKAVALYGPDGLDEAARVLAESRYLSGAEEFHAV